jgi:hypothetical protein
VYGHHNSFIHLKQNQYGKHILENIAALKEIARLAIQFINYLTRLPKDQTVSTMIVQVTIISKKTLI